MFGKEPDYEPEYYVCEVCGGKCEEGVPCPCFPEEEDQCTKTS